MPRATGGAATGGGTTGGAGSGDGASGTGSGGFTRAQPSTINATTTHLCTIGLSSIR
jgi:hypothetical protein